MTTLAAAAGTELTHPKVRYEEKDGEVKMGSGRTMRLDASLAECLDALGAIILTMTRAADGEGARRAFEQFWAEARDKVNVSENGGGWTVAAALRGAVKHGREAHRTLAELKREVARVIPGKGAARQPREKKKRRPEKEEEEEEVRKPKKTKKEREETEKKSKKGRKPNSSGQVCHVFRTTGKCPYGVKCIHRHLEDGDDSDAEDVRERE